MVLPFRRKGSDGDDDVVDQDIEDIMNEAEGLGEESGMTIPEPATDEGEDGEVDVAEMMAKSARTVIDTCMDVRGKHPHHLRPHHHRNRASIARRCEPSLGQGALGGHAQRTSPRG